MPSSSDVVRLGKVDLTVCYEKTIYSVLGQLYFLLEVDIWLRTDLMAITAEAQKELCKCKIYSQNFQHIVSSMPYVKACFEGKLLTFKVDFEQL